MSFQSGAIIPSEAGRIDSCRLFKCSWPIIKAVHPPAAYPWCNHQRLTGPGLRNSVFLSFLFSFFIGLPLVCPFHCSSSNIFQLLLRSTPRITPRDHNQLLERRGREGGREREREGERATPRGSERTTCKVNRRTAPLVEDSCSFHPWIQLHNCRRLKTLSVGYSGCILSLYHFYCLFCITLFFLSHFPPFSSSLSIPLAS